MSGRGFSDKLRELAGKSKAAERQRVPSSQELELDAALGDLSDDIDPQGYSKTQVRFGGDEGKHVEVTFPEKAVPVLPEDGKIPFNRKMVDPHDLNEEDIVTAYSQAQVRLERLPDGHKDAPRYEGYIIAIERVIDSRSSSAPDEGVSSAAPVQGEGLVETSGVGNDPELGADEDLVPRDIPSTSLDSVVQGPLPDDLPPELRERVKVVRAKGNVTVQAQPRRVTHNGRVVEIWDKDTYKDTRLD